MFLLSRFNVKNTYLYKFGWYVLSYRGDDAVDYQELSYAFDPDNPIQCIEQSEGDGNWTTMVELIQSIHDHTLSSAFFDVDAFIRAMMLEAFTQNFDGYNGISNNYLLANTKKNKAFWEWVAQDFDYSLSGTPPREEDLEALSSNVFSYAFNSKPLSHAVFSIPGTNESYALYIEKFISGTQTTYPGVANARLEALIRLATPVIARDLFYAASEGQNVTTFQRSSIALKDWIPERFENVSFQLAVATSATATSTGSVPVSTSSSSSTSETTTTTGDDGDKSSSGSTTRIWEAVIGSVVGAGLIAFMLFMIYSRVIKPYKDHARLHTSPEDDEL